MNDLAVVKGNVVEEKQYIVFHVEKEYFGIDIVDINSIIMVPKITPIPNMPDYFQGVISLRGHVIPVINLRKRMGLADKEISKETRIIVLNLENEELMGIIVDDVKEVVTLVNDEIEKTYHSASSGTPNYLLGVGKEGDNLISLLDIAEVMADKSV